MTIEKAIRAIRHDLHWKLLKGYQEDVAKTAISALEKQIPKKPIGGIDFAGNEYRICCECSAIIQDGGWKANYCPDCGQALDWGEKI